MGVATASDTPDVVLATFDGSKGTTFKWKDLNDPVMGGASTSTFHVDNKVGVFNGTSDLKVRSSTSSYKGFKAGFGAKNVPKSSTYGGASFKAGFQLKASSDWQVVKVPITDFSWDWSAYTGRCDTKDPGQGGKQHHCCGTGDAAQYCPKESHLSTINGLEVWAEGVAGDFHIEIQWIGASA